MSDLLCRVKLLLLKMVTRCLNFVSACIRVEENKRKMKSSRSRVWQCQQEIYLQCVNLSAFDLKMGFSRNFLGQFSPGNSVPTNTAIIFSKDAFKDFTDSAIAGSTATGEEVKNPFQKMVDGIKSQVNAMGVEFRKNFDKSNAEIKTALDDKPKSRWQERLALTTETIGNSVGVVADHPSFYATMGLVVPLANLALVLGVLEGRANEAYAAYRQFFSTISDSFQEDLKGKAKINKLRDEILENAKKLDTQREAFPRDVA